MRSEAERRPLGPGHGARQAGAGLGVLVSLLSLAACTPTLSSPRGEAHLDAMARAGRSYHHGRMREAAREYGVAAARAERRVDRDEARYRQAKSLARAGDLHAAIALLDDVAAARPVSRRTARALFDASLLRLRAGARAEGFAGLRLVCELHPSSGGASRALRLLLEELRARDAAAAFALLDALEARVGATALGDDILVHQARLRLEAGDRAAARSALERALREHPYPHGQRWDDALWMLADLAEEDGDALAAVGHLERMVAVHEHTSSPGSYTLPRFPAAQLRIGRLLRDELSDPEGAARALRRVYDEYPTSTLRDDALTELGELLLVQGRRAEACRLFGQVVEEFEVGRARRRAAVHLSARCP